MTDSHLHAESSSKFVFHDSHSLEDLNGTLQLEHQLNSTHNSLGSLEGSQFEQIASGLKISGKMSVVRRFFCLFVLFDFLMISLMWLICIMASIKNLLWNSLEFSLAFLKI